MPLQQLQVQNLDDANQRRLLRERVNEVLSHQFDDSRRRTAAELTAGVTPVNYAYAPGDVRRYGAVGDGATNDTTAFTNAKAANHAVYVPEGFSYNIPGAIVGRFYSFGRATITGGGSVGILTLDLGAGAASSFTNTALGVSALFSNAETATTGINNTAVGLNALLANTSGLSSTAVGRDSLRFNTTGTFNTALGSTSQQFRTTGSFNTAVGSNAMNGNQQSNPGVTGTSNNNVAVGSSSLYNLDTGADNTAVGTSAQLSNLTGNFNVAMGSGALSSNTAGNNNTAIGETALFSVTGSNNTALGYGSGGGITTGTGNTVIGANVAGLAAGLTNNIILANGTGAIQARHDGTNWTLTGTTTIVSGNIQTAAPNTPAGLWRLGSSSAVSPTAPNRTLEVSIGGTLFYIHAKTTND